EEDLSLTPQGIKYFGDHDMGDPRQGRRTPIDTVMEWCHHDFMHAVEWLARALGEEKPQQDDETPEADHTNERGDADRTNETPQQESMDESHLPRFSEETLALRFAERHMPQLRYVALWSRWMLWNGNCWKADDTRLTFSLAREICREAAGQCGPKKTKLAAQLASA